MKPRYRIYTESNSWQFYEVQSNGSCYWCGYVLFSGDVTMNEYMRKKLKQASNTRALWWGQPGDAPKGILYMGL